MGRLSSDQRLLVVNASVAVKWYLRDEEHLLREATRLWLRYGCTLFDGLYIACAAQTQAPLVTDERLLRTIGNRPNLLLSGKLPYLADGVTDTIQPATAHASRPPGLSWATERAEFTGRREYQAAHSLNSPCSLWLKTFLESTNA